MPSLQSVAVLALAGTVSAYPWTEDHVARSFEDEFSGLDLATRDASELFDNGDDLMDFYQRDIDGPYIEGQVLVRSARGGSKPSKPSGGASKPSKPSGGSGSKPSKPSGGSGSKPSKPSSGGGKKPSLSNVLNGAGQAASAFGDVGTGLTGIADVAGLFKGNGNSGSGNGNGGQTQSRRDLEELYGDSELLARDAAREYYYSSSRSPVSAPYDEADFTDHSTDDHQRGSYYLSIVKDHLGKRGIEDLDDDAGLIVREAKRRGYHSTSSLRHDHEDSHGQSALGHVEHGLAGISNVAGLFQGYSGSSSSYTNSKRSLDDILDESLEIYARELGIEDWESEY